MHASSCGPWRGETASRKVTSRRPDRRRLYREGQSHFVARESDGVRRVRRAWISEGERHESGEDGIWFPVSWSSRSAARPRRLPRPKRRSLSPADLVASLADVANGRNADHRRRRARLETIELRLAVGRERRGDGRVSDSRSRCRSVADGPRLPSPRPSRFSSHLPRAARTAAPAAAIPGVVDFVEAAMSSAREIVAAAARAELPQRLREVELVARIVGRIAPEAEWRSGSSRVRRLAGARAGRGRDQHGASRVRGAVIRASDPPKRKAVPKDRSSHGSADATS